MSAGAAGLATLGAAGCTDQFREEATAGSHHVGGTPTRAIPAEELPTGSTRSVQLEGRTLLLHRSAEDTVHAFSATCTHEGCAVAPRTRQIDGNTEDVFACPCHGPHFDVATGTPFGGPARRPLDACTAVVDEDWVTVTL